MTSSEIRNWLAIIAVVGGGIWTYFELNSNVDDLTERMDKLEKSLPVSVAEAREAAIGAINRSENSAINEIEGVAEEAIGRILDGENAAIAALMKYTENENRFWSIPVLSVEHSDRSRANGFFFNFDYRHVDRNLSDTDWTGSQFLILNPRTLRLATATMWRTPYSGSKDDRGHGRFNGERGSDWRTGDTVIVFGSTHQARN